MPPPCAACAAPAAPLACARCRCAFYCAAACQRAAWGAHKGVCVAGAADELPALGEWSKMCSCLACGTDGALRACLDCRCAYYCDEQCQRAAWGAHRDACRAAAAAPIVDDATNQPHCSQCACDVPRVRRKLCGRCHMVSYCGEECARTHWKAAGGHRGACAAAGAALFSCMLSKAGAGDRCAMFSVGAYYASGVGVAADTDAAVVWYKRAAAAGNVDAQYNLGCCYDSGDGVAVDAAAAFEWYTLAAEAGNVKAQFNLGCCYRDGTGVAADAAAAFKWYTRAAEVNHIEAMTCLALCYEEGLGVAVDFAKAMTLSTSAAEAGFAMAQCNLGLIYLEGSCGVVRDVAKAREWFSRATAGGKAKAAVELAKLDAAALP